MELKIKYLADIDPIERIKQGDWIDLRLAEDAVMFPGDYKLLRLGVAMQLPEGYEALCVPRSSTFSRWGILLGNSIGVIDESYCGDDDEWRFPAYATRKVIIPKNTRIAQFRLIYHQPQFDIVTVDELGNKNRGGIGSTGEV